MRWLELECTGLKPVELVLGEYVLMFTEWQDRALKSTTP